MDRSDTIKLLCTAFVADEYGVERKTTTGREVFCQVNSITRQEFFEAGRNGLNPELMFSVFVDDYKEVALALCDDIGVGAQGTVNGNGEDIGVNSLMPREFAEGVFVFVVSAQVVFFG